jgi:hypothetical protein
LPCLQLFAHRVEVPLHPIYSDRDAVDQRERLRVLSKYRSQHSRNNVSPVRAS